MNNHITTNLEITPPTTAYDFIVNVGGEKLACAVKTEPNPTVQKENIAQKYWERKQYPYSAIEEGK